MTYPILYSPGHTDFNNLGLGVMVDCTSAIVSEELNGKFELDIKYLAYGPLTKYLVNDAQIKVDTGDQEGQLFRIKTVGKNIDGIIPIHAEHVSYITNDLPIKPKIFVPNANGALALQSALNNIIGNHPLTSFSDVTTASDLSWEVPTFKNIRNIFGGVEGSILDKIGGEYQFDNYQIRLLSQRGRYSNTIIAYGRNLTDFNKEENILEVYTSIYPIVVESKDNTQTVKTLPEYIIDGEYVDKYPNRRVTIIDFSDKFNDKNLYSEDKLRKLAQDYVKTNKIGVPKFSMTVSTVDLSGALDDSYNVEKIESLHLADTVKVFFEPLGVTEEAKVVGSVWNVLLDQYDSYTLGAKKASFGQWVNNSINEVKNEADSAKRNALEAVASANGKNTNYYGNSGDGFPENPKVGDLYFQKDGDKTTIYQWDGSSWVNLIDTSWQDDFEADIQGKLDQAKEETDAALAEKDKAINDLDKKVTDKITQTNTAVTQAQSDATAAKSQADAAVAKANSNIKDIEDANIKIADLNNLANQAKSDAMAAKDNATMAITNAQSALEKANGVSNKVTTIETDINTINGALSIKANTTDVDAIKKRVTTAETNITQNANDIQLKASKSDVDTINSKVTSVESSVKVQSGQITALNSKTDGHTTQIGNLESSYNGLTSTVSSTVTGITNNSLISTQMIKDTTLKHPNFSDMPMVEVPVTNGETYTVTTNQPWEANAAHVFYIRTTNTVPNSSINGVYDGKSITLPALSEKIYIVFRNQSYANRFINGQYWVKVEVTPVSQIKVSQLTQDLDGFKTTVANTYADKVSVASQINQSATEITSNVQSWTNNILTSYSTTQQTTNSIINAVSSKADKTQITQLSDQITSTVTSLTNETLVSTQMIRDTTLRHPNFPDMPMVEISVTNGESYTVSSNMPNRGTATAAISDIFFLTVQTTVPNSNINGVFQGKNITLPAISNKIYIVFRTSDYANQFISGKYWVKVSTTPASQSQITQLVNDINLRVIKGDVVNQINISPESILIAGNKIQITGQTYIENGVIDDAKIKTLSASKLTTGTIDAAKINVLNINAANITTGILNADRIGANSINATHINVANLAAISADLGIITAGIINAATVRIINLDAGAISTGTLNANRIAAYSITADKIQATSLDLFNADFYTNVQADGMRMQGKAQIIFGKWKDSSGVVRNSDGLYIGGYNAGVKYVALTRADGSTFMLRANSDMDIGTNTNVAKESLNIYDTVHLWYPQINHSDLILNGYFAMGGGIQEGSIQYDKNAGTMNFRVPGDRSGSYFWFNQNVNAAGTFNTVSRLSLKNVKGEYKGDALKEICDTNIVEYSYKNNPKARQLSPIIDDVNKIKQFTLPDIINDGKTVNLYAMSSLSWLAIQELAKKLENIEEKIDAIA
ncbi:phage tail spike protein [Lactococcus lactis subsp. lactis]|uniref:phage tail spike protein n=1 Tax=Lactococcus lactis TaxID=1358 RepID=UPI002647F207|nr:phage tail spike protein [Lactococcus lactis]WKB49146.1 phage tail spike protein [Lactococcus lactis subsp. lactis]